MPAEGCPEAMEVLNTVFATGLILNDGHEIAARLERGDDASEILSDLAVEFGQPDMCDKIEGVVGSWPSLHMEAVTYLVGWALGKLDTDDRVTINWKGDADYHETVTKFELRDHALLIEFAHPPTGAAAHGAAS